MSKYVKVFKSRCHIKKVIDTHLYFLEHADQTVWGSISEEDVTAIIENVKKAANYPGPIVEIGALFGFTTQIMATYKPVDKGLIAVEDFSWNPFMIPRHAHKIIIDRVLYYCVRHCNTSLFEGSNRQFYETYGGERPSMVFIDADHSYEGVMVDIEWAKNVGVPIISGHDYCDMHPGIKHAVDEVFGKRIFVIGSVWTAERV